MLFLKIAVLESSACKEAKHKRIEEDKINNSEYLKIVEVTLINIFQIFYDVLANNEVWFASVSKALN